VRQTTDEKNWLNVAVARARSARLAAPGVYRERICI
jgi:hypothetical protein